MAFTAPPDQPTGYENFEVLDSNTIITFAHLYGATFDMATTQGLCRCHGNGITTYGNSTADAARSWLKLRRIHTKNIQWLPS